MKKQDELTPEERKLLQEFNACKNEAEKHAWVQKNRDLFQPAAEQRGNMTWHSGLNGINRREAEIHCERHSAVMLERTTGGRILEKADLYNTVSAKQADRLFVASSEIYTDSAQGKTRTLTVMAQYDRVFLDKEMPKMLHNKDVTHINEVPRKELLKTWHNDQSPDKLQAKQEIASKINQGIKQIGWDGNKAEQKQEPQQREAQPQAGRRDVSEEKLTANQQREPQQKQRRDVSEGRISAETQKQAPQQQQATRRDVSEERIGQQQPRQNTRRDVSEEKINQQRETQQQQSAQEQEQARQRR